VGLVKEELEEKKGRPAVERERKERRGERELSIKSLLLKFGFKVGNRRVDWLQKRKGKQSRDAHCPNWEKMEKRIGGQRPHLLRMRKKEISTPPSERKREKKSRLQKKEGCSSNEAKGRKLQGNGGKKGFFRSPKESMEGMPTFT